MSRHHRARGLWPADDLAVSVWHMVALTEDIVDLIEASKGLNSPESKAALVKKALVDLKSFDELVGGLKTTLHRPPGPPLPSSQLATLKDAVSTYDRTMEPSRELLARIRNNLGAHRRGLPRDEERKKFRQDFKARGAWEQALHNLELHCQASRWIDQINEAINLRNVVASVAPGAWFSTDGNQLRFYNPLRIEPPSAGVDDGGESQDS